MGKRPSGGDAATRSLQLLGAQQLDMSLKYLRQSYPYQSALDEQIHEHYHSLRKELRSLTDEFDILGKVMIPMTEETISAIDTLKDARKLLGDMNDDWTAYSMYVDYDEHHKRQKMRAEKLHKAWRNFKQWVVDCDFEGVIVYLAQCMNSTLTYQGEIYETGQL